MDLRGRSNEWRRGKSHSPSARLKIPLQRSEWVTDRPTLRLVDGLQVSIYVYRSIFCVGLNSVDLDR